MNKNKVCVSKQKVYLYLPLILIGIALAVYLSSLQSLNNVKTSTNTRAYEPCEDWEVRRGGKCVTPTPKKKGLAQPTQQPTPTPIGYCPSYLPTNDELLLKRVGIPFKEYTDSDNISGTNGRIYIEQRSDPKNCLAGTSIWVTYSKTPMTNLNRFKGLDNGKYVYRKIYVYTNPFSPPLYIAGRATPETYLYTNTFRREACDMANFIINEKNIQIQGRIWFQNKLGVPTPCNEQDLIQEPDAYQFTVSDLYDSSETGKYYSHYKPPKN